MIGCISTDVQWVYMVCTFSFVNYQSHHLHVQFQSPSLAGCHDMWLMCPSKTRMALLQSFHHRPIHFPSLLQLPLLCPHRCHLQRAVDLIYSNLQYKSNVKKEKKNSPYLQPRYYQEVCTVMYSMCYSRYIQLSKTYGTSTVTVRACPCHMFSTCNHRKSTLASTPYWYGICNKDFSIK